MIGIEYYLNIEKYIDERLCSSLEILELLKRPVCSPPNVDHLDTRLQTTTPHAFDMIHELAVLSLTQASIRTSGNRFASWSPLYTFIP
jgi:hypothetical protein